MCVNTKCPHTNTVTVVRLLLQQIPTKYHSFFTTYHCKDSRDLHEQLKIGFIIIPGNEAEPCHGYSLFEAVCVMYCDMSCLS